MAVQKLEQWAAKYVNTLPLSSLDGAVIGVDASYYLNQCLNENNEEPLKVALGGVPFTITARIEEDLQAAKDAGLRLVFIFDGLDHVQSPHSNARSSESQRAHEQGWTHYLGGDPKSTVQDFGKAEYPLGLVSRHLRRILHNNGVEFLVAPFSSLAWLAYLYHLDQGQPIDAIMASPDAFLFDVDKIILSIDAKERNFNWLFKADCVSAAAAPSPQAFQDAQLLLGSAFLPTFPLLQRNPEASIREAVSMLGRGNPLQLCTQYRDDPVVAESHYADQYKKAVLTIRHHIVITPEGAVQPMDIQHAPGEVHVFVGQRLPDELFFYISRGLLDPQVPNWLATGKIRLTLPGGAVDSEPFRRLVYDQLNPLRIQCVKLLAESLHFYFQAKHITIEAWDGRSMTQPLKDAAPLKEKVSSWKIQDSSTPSLKSGKAPTILSCLRMLKEKDFSAKSISSAKNRVEHPALKSQNEIIANVFWRFLRIRDFVDDKHQLTSWGRMLEAALANIDGGSKKEEQAVLAIELLRLGLLNTQSPVGVNVAPNDKAAEHKRNTNLLSKIACIGRLKHEPVGYVGPLDKGLLTFAWEITFLRELLRDLAETILATMFLNGDASRVRDDWQELSQRLPFISDNGSSLGIAVKSYLDALNDRPDGGPSLEDLKEMVKSQEKPYAWFSKVEDGTIHKSLETAFKLFDAVYAAVTVGEKEVKDASIFSTAHEWLACRR